VVVGMLVATVLGIILVPGLFAWVEGLGKKKEAAAVASGAPAAAPAPAAGGHGGHGGHEA
jgi:hypothetical protein